ncbi:MAG: hypothetical protein M3N29_07440 [Chloroflexota bacterium]|nr:hypothetical protein [Chloroflexota bacterium]
MRDDYLNSDPDSPATEPEISPAGRDERPTRPDDQLPEEELSAADVRRLAGNEPSPGSAPARPAAEHPQRLPNGNYVGEDNIRDGNVGGVIGGPHQQGGQGQGG